MMPGRISKNMEFPRFSGWRGLNHGCDSGDGFFCVFVGKSMAKKNIGHFQDEVYQ